MSTPALPELFECPRRPTLRLTAVGCAGNWRAAKSLPDKSESHLLRCRGCAIGAGHAGQPVEASRAVSPAQMRECVRCTRKAWKLVHDTVCVSCYNREREVALGVNRRGTAPVKAAAVLRPVAVGAASPKGLAVLHATVASPREALLVATRSGRAMACINLAVGGLALARNGNVM